MNDQFATTHRRPTRALCTLLLCGTTVWLAGCPSNPDGTGRTIDLSPGDQDITFKLQVDPVPPLGQGQTASVSVKLVDDDDERDPASGNPLPHDPAEDAAFSSRVDLRIVEPLPLGVTATFASTALSAGESTTLELSAASDAPPAAQSFLIAGTLRDSTTTRYFPNGLTIGTECAEGTQPARSVAASAAHSAAVLADGRLLVWGYNESGDRDRSSPQAFAHGAWDLAADVPSVVLWAAPHAVSDVAGAVRVDGSDPFFTAHLGDGRHVIVGPYYHSAVRAPLSRSGWHETSLPMSVPFAQVASASSDEMGHYFSLYDGRLDLWEDAGRGLEARTYDLKIRVAQIAVGQDHAVGHGNLLVLREDGLVYTRLASGIGDLTAVPGLAGVRAVAAGGRHFLALLSDGTVRAWGLNTDGELGVDRSIDFAHTPQVVPGIGDVVAVAAGESFSLALRRDGTVFAWGSNEDGALGRGVSSTELTSSSTPEPVAGVSGVTAIAAGARHALALRGDGTVLAWGNNARGQLGIGTAIEPLGQPAELMRALPLPVLGIGAGAGTSRCRNEDVQPRARFTLTPASPLAGDEVRLDASTSIGGKAGIVSFDWEVRLPDSAAGPGLVVSVLTGATVAYQFGSPGDYEVRLRVTNALGAADETTQRVAVGQSTGSGVKFFDGQFEPDDWTLEFARVGSGHEHSVGQVPDDGNLGAYRRVTIEMAPSGTDPQAMQVYNWKKSAVYDPGVRGAITALKYSLDTRVFVTDAAGNPQRYVTAIVRQNGKVFAAAGLRITPSSQSWSRREFPFTLVAPDLFSEIRPDVVYLDPNSHPDFSANGAPLQFGFMVTVYGPVGSGFGARYVTGFDNWSVTTL